MFHEIFGFVFSQKLVSPEIALGTSIGFYEDLFDPESFNLAQRSRERHQMADAAMLTTTLLRKLKSYCTTPLAHIIGIIN